MAARQRLVRIGPVGIYRFAAVVAIDRRPYSTGYGCTRVAGAGAIYPRSMFWNRRAPSDPRPAWHGLLVGHVPISCLFGMWSWGEQDGFPHSEKTVYQDLGILGVERQSSRLSAGK